jgi:type I restriction enzyme S subunit
VEVKEWQEYSLGDLLKYEQPTKYLVKTTHHLNAGLTPVLTAGKTFLLGFTNDTHGVYNSIPTILFDDFTTATKYVNFPFKVKSSACKMLTPINPEHSLKYLSELMSNVKFSPYDHKRYWISEFSRIKVRIPGPVEQKAIAEVLSDVDDLISIKKNELKKRTNIAAGIISKVIDGSYFQRESIAFEFRTIKDLGIKVEKGALITEKTARPGKVPVVAGGIKPAYYHEEPNRTGITITVSASGANAGFVNIWRGEIWASDCSTVSESSDYDVRYIYYVLLGLQSEIYKSQYGGAQPHVRPNEIYNLVIPWVDFDKQHFVAEMLEDVFFEIKFMQDQIAKYEGIKEGMKDELLAGRIKLV